MGGSGISGDVVAAAFNDELPVPVTVLKQIRTPAFVGPGHARVRDVVLGRHRGDASRWRAARSRRARSSSRSRAAASSRRSRATPAALHVPCPPGFLPRAAVGALVAPLCTVLFRLGLAPGRARVADARAGAAAPGGATRAARRSTGRRIPARELARRIGRTIPLVYGGGALGAVAAYRWKCDVNENAKAPAFWHTYPELDHNEICAWGQHGDVTRQLITLVELRHGFEHPRLRLRFDATREIIDECVHQVLSVEAEGEGRLAQLLDLMYVGDWTSCYLALQNDVDPGPIDAIFALKARMSSRRPESEPAVHVEVEHVGPRVVADDVELAA